MSRALKLVGAVFFSFLLFSAVLFKAGWQNFILSLSLFFSATGVVLAILTFFSLYFGVLRWRRVVGFYDSSLSDKKSASVYLAGFLLNYFTPFLPFSAEFFKAYILQKKFDISAGKSIAMSAVDKILETTVFFIFLIGGLVAFAFWGKIHYILSAGVLLIAAGFLFLLLLFYFQRFRRQSVFKLLFRLLGPWQSRILKRQDEQTILLAEKIVFDFFSWKNKTFWLGFLFSFVRYACLFLRAFVLLFFLTGQWAFFRGLAVLGFAHLAMMSPFPAALGILELSEGLAFSGLGFDFNSGAVFGLAWRAFDLLACLACVFFVARLFFDVLSQRIVKLGFSHFSKNCHSEAEPKNLLH